MSKMLKCISAMVIVSLMFNTIALADNLTEQLKMQNQEVQKNQVELKNTQQDIEKIEIEIEQSDSEIEKLMIEIENGKKEIDNTQKDMKNIEKKINNIQNNIEEEKDLFNQRMRVMYTNGIENYLEVLLDAKGMNDFLSRLENIKKVIEYDKQFLINLEVQEEAIKYEQEKLNRKQTYLLGMEEENKNKLGVLEKEKQEQSNLIEKLKQYEKLISDRVNSYKALTEETLRKIRENKEVEKQNSESSSVLDSNQLYNNEILEYAANFIGTPYVWGGTKPVPGFDCSGFVQYVYAHFDIKISRTTYTQIKDGVEIARENLQPGDLVFFGTEDNPHHVGIYCGNNNFIHAPRTGDVIKISPMTRKDYLTARRVVGN